MLEEYISFACAENYYFKFFRFYFVQDDMKNAKLHKDFFRVLVMNENELIPG